MEGSGANANLIPVVFDGEETKIMVIADRDRVQFGDRLSMDRHMLLAAIGVPAPDVVDLT